MSVPLKRQQTENFENIKLINENIISLQQSHDALKNEEENHLVMITKQYMNRKKQSET